MWACSMDDDDCYLGGEGGAALTFTAAGHMRAYEETLIAQGLRG